MGKKAEDNSIIGWTKYKASGTKRSVTFSEGVTGAESLEMEMEVWSTEKKV